MLDRLDSLDQQSEGLKVKIRNAGIEQREVSMRRLNIMCFRVKESTAENVAIRNEADKASLNHITYDVLDVTVKEFSFGGSLVRIGAYDENKTRPLRIKATRFGSQKRRKTARNKLKNYEDSKLKEIFFKSDLTKKQRAEAFTRRENRRKERAKERRRSTNPVGEVEPTRETAGERGGGPFQGSKK